MKKIFKLYLLALSFVIASSCDDGFDKLNTSKTGATSLDPAFVLNNAIVASGPTSNQSTTVYDEAIVQHFFSSNTGVLEGGNFNKVVVNNTPLTWNEYYQNVIKYTNDVITRTKSDPLRSNLFNMAKIIQANAFLVLTDTYGDIPYGEAGGGYTAQVFFPKYETQQAIYPKIIQDLQDAVVALDPAGKIETSDILYNGNIAQWKKFANSLLLRAGMRLSKADPAKAASTVATAIAGGVILTNADNAIIKYDGNFVNATGNQLNGTEAANFYMSDVLVLSLQAAVSPKNVGGTTVLDPRLQAIGVRYVGATSGAGQTTGVATTAPANQYGMPVGSTDGTADAAAAAAIGAGNNRFGFTQIDRTRIVKRTSPLFLVTAAQCNLLLAEAGMRGFGGKTTVTANTDFRLGINAHMDQMAQFDPLSAIPGGDATRIAYLAAPECTLNVGSLALSLPQIGYQYWLASLLHGPEAWASFRRLGYPALTPNPFSGSAVPGSFIMRLTYPSAETVVNGKNVSDAIAGMGGTDALSVKVWWNK